MFISILNFKYQKLDKFVFQSFKKFPQIKSIPPSSYDLFGQIYVIGIEIDFTQYYPEKQDKKKEKQNN